MVVSEFADVTLQVKPIRGSNENTTVNETRSKVKENLVRNHAEKFATMSSNLMSKKDDASTGLSNVSSNLRLP